MRKKITYQMLLIAGLAVISTLILVAGVYYRLFCGQIKEDLKTAAAILSAAGFPDNLKDRGVEEAPEFDASQLRITWITENGEVRYDNGAGIGEMGNHRGRPEIEQAFREGEGWSVRRSDTLGRNTFYYAMLLREGTVLRVSRETGSILSVYFSAVPALLAIAAGLLLLSLLLTHILTGKLLEPIRRLTQDTDGGSADYLDGGYPDGGYPDRIGNYSELRPLIETLRRQHEDILKNARIRQEFTANVSHELKTPLAAISGYSELIENGMAADEDITRFAGEIHRNAVRLLTLINDVIRLSQLDSPEASQTAERLDLYEMAEACVNMLRMSAEKHGVTLTLIGQHSYLSADRQMIEELLYNLCDNAIRYNNAGGTVTVRAFTDREGRPALQVEDTGIGIPPEHQERIFERFYRVDKSRSKSTGGTGLGLAIVKHIVAGQGAQMELHSEVGKGTRITVVFGKQTDKTVNVRG